MPAPLNPAAPEDAAPARWLAEHGSDVFPAVVAWQARAGRHGLPWQDHGDVYRVWLSEIMLQQTQVATVLDYFPRFVARFPDVAALAAAPLEEVMALWSGLGYYSRARNLHRCAQQVVAEHGGRFPADVLALQRLAGIGASTAAAIAAFGFGARVSILDGNVRRVLTRLLAYGGDVSVAANQRELWQVAQALVPPSAPCAQALSDMRRYTQGLMDLGATLCTRSKPRCGDCPLAAQCRARAAGAPLNYPVKTQKLKRQHHSWSLLHLRHVQRDGVERVWLTQRPPTGIWGSLWCLPVFDSEVDLRARLAQALPQTEGALQALEPFVHHLTHRELRLHTWRLDLGAGEAERLAAVWPGQWVATQALAQHGLPRVVALCLQR